MNFPNSVPNIDLQLCSREPIRFLGKIQAHGYFLAIDTDTLAVCHFSNNISEVIDTPLTELIGVSLRNVQFKGVESTELVSMVTAEMEQSSVDTLNPNVIQIRNQEYYLVMHPQDHLYILEFEPKDKNAIPVSNLIGRVMQKIQQSRTIQDLLNSIVNDIKVITQYDRVMVYKFDEEWNGKVVAEAKEEHLEPFLGLHYPESDIPAQARELYRTNLVRTIVDAQKPAVEIFPGTTEQGQTLDLTHSILRAVSPVHIEYLKNMEVHSSMSFSLLYKGQLWGLIACHHYQGPRLVDFSSRMAGKVICQMLSSALEFRKDEEDLTTVNRLWKNEHSLFEQMQLDWKVVDGLTKMDVTGLDITSATGMALLLEDELYTLGKTPSEQAIYDLVEWLKAKELDSIYHTNALPRQYQAAEQYRETASGLLAIELSRELGEYVLWFKPEVLEQVSWAGNPADKAVQIDTLGNQRIGPRKSFVKWTETARNKSDDWLPTEINVALKLREHILQVISQKTTQLRILNEQLRQAYEELDAFSYTVSHDLRSPLSTIKTFAEVILIDYGEELNGEIMPLFEKIVSASDKMGELIREILHYARTGRSEINATDIDINDLVRSNQEELLISEKDRNLSIEVGELPPLTGDKTMIMQVFNNILSNAIKYTRAIPEGRIRIQGEKKEGEIVYSITDNGIGVDPKQSGKVFELFKRLDNVRDYEGHGVGLAIVKRIMQRHGGKVWFTSIPFKETTFYLTFPTT